MYKYIITAIIFTSPFLALTQTSIDWNDEDIEKGKIIITYSPESFSKKAESESSNINGLVIEQLEKLNSIKHIKKGSYKFILPNYFIGEFEPNEMDRILSELKKDKDVISVELISKLYPQNHWGTATPNDQIFLWGMERIKSSYGWERQSSRRSSVKVAVCEGGDFSTTHPDLTRQTSTLQNSTGVVDSHATHVAGTIAATGNNEIGVVGVANIEIVPLFWGRNLSDFIRRISWAYNNDIKIVNMSFGWFEEGFKGSDCHFARASSAVQTAINNASDRIVFIGATGNAGCTSDDDNDLPIPASYDNVLGVSAINKSDQLADFSNFGDYVDLTAPGVGIWSTIPINSYQSWNGTSMAAPHVSGVAATIFSLRTDFTAKSVVRLLLLTAEDIGQRGKDNKFGWGVVRVDNAIKGLANVYAESNYSNIERGTLHQPYNSVREVINAVETGRTIGLVRGSTFDEVITFDKPCTIISVGGASTIGQ